MSRSRPVFILMLGWCSSVACGQEDQRDYPTIRRAYLEKARGLEFVLDDEPSTMLNVGDEPVMTWTSIGGWSGSVFVWTGNGRIQIVGCIGSQRLADGATLNFFQEFHSLADGPLREVTLGAGRRWQVPYETTPFLPIPGSPKPGTTPAQRLIQMRALARSFSVGMQVTGDDVEQKMRMLTQPLARQTVKGKRVIDSALFTFVSSSGTDPEAFLLIEARKTDAGPIWTYSPARFTTREIWMSHRGTEVWRVEPVDGWDSLPKLGKPYFYRNESTATLTELNSTEPQNP